MPQSDRFTLAVPEIHRIVQNRTIAFAALVNNEGCALGARGFHLISGGLAALALGCCDTRGNRGKD